VIKAFALMFPYMLQPHRNDYNIDKSKVNHHFY